MQEPAAAVHLDLDGGLSLRFAGRQPDDPLRARIRLASEAEMNGLPPVRGNDLYGLACRQVQLDDQLVLRPDRSSPRR